ncbi:MAG: hypothetical protein QGI78_01045 [Phycisphaerales bacterium]|jgi:hypothetical protein|nr:hypothetical protein [Phycisphaerales bacterium]
MCEEQHSQDDVVDRRGGLDRRVVEGSENDLNRRRGPGRRRSDFVKSAEEGEMTTEQFQFLMAINEFKRANNRSFPTWTDVLEVVRKLGYRKTQKSEITLGPNIEDWVEKPDSDVGA